jgi:hypothetical protein
MDSSTISSVPIIMNAASQAAASYSLSSAARMQ